MFFVSPCAFLPENINTWAHHKASLVSGKDVQTKVSHASNISAVLHTKEQQGFHEQKIGVMSVVLCVQRPGCADPASNLTAQRARSL